MNKKKINDLMYSSRTFFETKIVHDLVLRKCVILLKICGLGEKENP